MIREVYCIQGIVQGVGFRPFVYKIAHELNLSGFVKNSISGVTIEVEGNKKSLQLFEEYLHSQLPPLAHIDTLSKTQILPTDSQGFEIIQSDHPISAKSARISPDIATCKECLQDLKNGGKYHNYFALNCTNCGPRYSIIQTVPYDRKHTSMSKFEMCSSCQEEYTNPRSRRYHAQPIACNHCGARLALSIKGEHLDLSDEEKFQNVARSIKDGQIGAIKGIGGFHLVCDATNDEAIFKLRKYKNRPTKPFAIMCKDLQQVQSFGSTSKEEEILLTSKEAPIVLIKKLPSSHNKLSGLLAPNIESIGFMLASTPLHHLLFEYLQDPIVATSANLGNEPIITNEESIYEKLPFVDFVLDFDRDIVNGVDDSVVQVIQGKKQTLRLARGYAPKLIKLPFQSDKKILALGANQKNSIAFVIDDNIILSAHIGDLDSIESFEYFQRTIQTFQGFYDFEADLIIHDKHPSYMTSKWAKTQAKERIEVQHHVAHIYACMAEFGLRGQYLGFSFDGTGYGDEALATLWGGEIFLGDQRKYWFSPIKLLGGEKAIKEPRRVALSMLFEQYTFEEMIQLNLECINSFSTEEIKLLHQSYTHDLNAPKSSSVGRLFDAMASFADLLQIQSYEGEAGLICEQNYNPNITQSFEYKIIDGAIDIAYDFFDKEIVSKFINTLVKIVVDIAKIEKLEVILSGGVFQNKTLLTLLIKKFEEESIIYYFQQETAINDGGIALGQAYYYLIIN
ncbi:MAG: carbamoyltransferase HypF [Helicobacteraceae bacterium]|nr:carbamoyltransferase HypF [Helicobacteraceae bacterium]